MSVLPGIKNSILFKSHNKLSCLIRIMLFFSPNYSVHEQTQCNFKKCSVVLLRNPSFCILVTLCVEVLLDMMRPVIFDHFTWIKFCCTVWFSCLVIQIVIFYLWSLVEKQEPVLTNAAEINVNCIYWVRLRWEYRVFFKKVLAYY